MITRDKFPFIYFFLEPNIVFVYKIEELRYVTVNDLIKSGNWQTFELDFEVEFAEFNHEESEPLSGRGYFVNQEVHNIMARKINQLIKKYRYSTRQEEKTEIHLTCAESAAGPLRVGLDRPNKVVAFQSFFSMGPIWQLESKAGQADRHDWLDENINIGQEPFELENKFNNTLFEIEDIPEDVLIYLWTANNSEEQTGIRFILRLLKDKANKVILLNTTELCEKDQEISHTASLHPKKLKQLYEQNKHAKPLSIQERVSFEKEWEALAQSKEVLRVWNDERIGSVPESYYDPLIIQTIERMHTTQGANEFIKAGRVIGEIMGQTDGIVGDSYLEYRIRHLIYSGVLALKGVPRSMRHYSVKLR